MQRTVFKLIIPLLLCVASFSLITPVAAQTGPYAVANTAVFVRGGPGTGFWILSTLNAGEMVPILNSSPDGAWWFVNAPAGEGWVAKISVTAHNADGVTVLDPGPIGTVMIGNLNVRFGAGINATSLGLLSQGSQVLVMARNADGSWLQVHWGFGTGWVAADHVAVTGTPAVTADTGVTNAVPLSSDQPFVIVNSGFLNVRSGPGINFAVLGTVGGGEQYPIIGRSNDNTWYQIQAPFGPGWVFSGFVVTRNEFGGSPVTTAGSANAAVTGPIGVVNTGALNIRSGPGSQFTSLGVLAGGTETQIVGRTGDWTWWLLDTPVGTGWANAMFIIVRGDSSTVPHVAPGTSVAPAPGQAGAEAPQPAIAGPVAFVNSGALNIRSGPNGTFPSLGSVYAGTRMPIIGQSLDHGWWLVESPYGNGWVSKLYVIPEGPTSGIPVVQ